MSRSRRNAPIAVVDNTSCCQKSPQNTPERAAASTKKCIKARNAKTTQRYPVQEGEHYRNLPGSQQQSEGPTATNGRGLVRLKNFFKHSLSRSGREPKRGSSETGFDTKTNMIKAAPIVPSSSSSKSRVAAYIPQHAASDYSKTALPFETTHNDAPVPNTARSTSPEDPISFQPSHKSSGPASSISTDYEAFIQTEQRATTQAALKRMSQGTLPEAPLNIPASSYATRRENRISVLSSPSRTSQPSSKPSIRSSARDSMIPEGQQTPQLRRSTSLLMKVGEYIKPPMAESMHSHRRGESTGSLRMDVGEKRNKRWSTLTSQTLHEH